MTETKPEQHTIDATNGSIGRVASETAKILMGKHRSDFARHVIPNLTVTIENASQINVSPEKRRAKVYLSYSGYPGGQRSRSMDQLIEKKGYGEVLRRAVYGMLPANRLRKQMMKRLVIKE